MIPYTPDAQLTQKGRKTYENRNLGHHNERWTPPLGGEKER